MALDPATMPAGESSTPSSGQKRRSRFAGWGTRRSNSATIASSSASGRPFEAATSATKAVNSPRVNSLCEDLEKGSVMPVPSVSMNGRS